VTTDTDENAMAIPANMGFSKVPVKGYRIPIAMGMPARLYINAQKRFW